MEERETWDESEGKRGRGDDTRVELFDTTGII